MSSPMVIYEVTPNPQAMKFVITDRLIHEGTAQYLSFDETAFSPLARKLFGFPWAKGVLIGPNFVSVTKQDWVDWAVLADPLSDLIAEHIQSGQPVVIEGGDHPPKHQSARSESRATSLPDNASTEDRIRYMIDQEIRPAVAMDGGDVQFSHFENGVVYLEMLGSCSGCPSSTYTLKEGIETRMRSAIPEVLEVVAIS